MKFNIFKNKRARIANYQGTKAFKLTPEFELYTAAVTSGLNPSAYEDGDNRLERIKTLVAQCDPVFVAKLAIYVRTKMYLRTIPIVLIVELAKIHSGDSLVSIATCQVIQRADEITELLAYYQKANIMFLSHPTAKNTDQQVIFNKLIADNLEIPYTWETELSKVGQIKYRNEGRKQKAITKTWESLIDSGRLGYMALLRNLRNITQANVSGKHMQKVCDYISDERNVKRSKQLPFRFLSAYRELKVETGWFTSSILDALEKAVLISAGNIKGFGYETSVVIACDVSGSMQKAVSPRSKILLYDIGLILGMLMQSRCKNVISGMFGDKWKVINMPKRSILSNVDEYYRREGLVGYSTNGFKVIQDLIFKRKAMDKIMIFTDTQMWNSTGGPERFDTVWRQYKSKIAPNAKLYLFDLAGYGQSPIDIKQNDVYLLAGWSDKIFDMLYAIEKGSDAIAAIKAMSLTNTE